MFDIITRLCNCFGSKSTIDDATETKTVSEHDMVRDEIIKQRMEYAAQQENDYSHVFRLKTYFELIRLSVINVGIEMAFCAETAFVPPILLSMGIEHTHMTMVFAISPFLGFFLSPILGSISDRCRSRFGRRRPMLLLLSIGAVAGLLCIVGGQTLFNMHKNELNVTDVNSDEIFSETVKSNKLIWAIVVAIIGTLLTEFNADMSQLASRTYMLDICLPQDHAKTLSLFSLMAGVGGIFGFVIGAIDWNSTIFANILGDNIQTLFSMVAIIYFVTEIITITSFREIPLRLVESDKMLQPITQAVIEQEVKKRIPEENQVEGKQVEEKLKDVESNEEVRLSVSTYIKSIIFLPSALKILCLTNCFAWSGHIVYCLFFTDFVGESLFKGDPKAAHGSWEYERYYEGVRFACWGRVVYALTCIFFSMAIEKLMNIFSTRVVFISSMLSFAAGMGILGYFPTYYGVILFSITAGLVNGAVHTIPFLLVAKYHEKGVLKNSEESSTESRGIGMDCGIVGSMMFVGLFTMSLSVGSIITLIGSTSAICYTAGFFSFLAAFTALFVTYVD